MQVSKLGPDERVRGKAVAETSSVEAVLSTFFSLQSRYPARSLETWFREGTASHNRRTINEEVRRPLSLNTDSLPGYWGFGHGLYIELFLMQP